MKKKEQEYQQFNTAAQTYDEVFTHSTIGKLQRNRVYHWLNKIHFFASEKKVFEINCGTGYDAHEFTKRGHKVVATDGSDKMIEYAKRNRNKQISFFPLDFSQVATNSDFKNSEVLFSNFGGLNCISEKELRTLVAQIGKEQKTKDILAWVIMPKVCIIETLYFLFKLDFGKLFRRKTDKAVGVNVEGVSVNTYYHSPSTLKNMLKEEYNILLTKPVAIFLPPSYMESFFSSHYKILGFLNKLELFFGRFTFLSGLSDHFIIIAEKK